jgi:TPR repeat protein
MNQKIEKKSNDCNIFINTKYMDGDLQEINNNNFDTICAKLLEYENDPNILIRCALLCWFGNGVVDYMAFLENGGQINVRAMARQNNEMAIKFVHRAIRIAGSEILLIKMMIGRCIISGKLSGYYDDLNDLANIYRFGIGVNKDHHRAFELYKMAGENGSTVGHHNTAQCYHDGIGIEVDLKKATDMLMFECETKIPNNCEMIDWKN